MQFSTISVKEIIYTDLKIKLLNKNKFKSQKSILSLLIGPKIYQRRRSLRWKFSQVHYRG